MQLNDIKENLMAIYERLIELFPDIPWEHSYFAGGCIRDMAKDIKPKDYDIYFNVVDIEPIRKALQIHFNKVTVLDNYETTIEINDETIICQFVTLVYGNPSKVTSEFDYTVNSNFFQPYHNILIVHQDAYGWKLVTCDKVSRPMHALYRLEKFIQKGYTISQPSLVRMVEQISGTKVTTERLAELTHPISPDRKNKQETQYYPREGETQQQATERLIQDVNSINATNQMPCITRTRLPWEEFNRWDPRHRYTSQPPLEPSTQAVEPISATESELTERLRGIRIGEEILTGQPTHPNRNGWWNQPLVQPVFTALSMTDCNQFAESRTEPAELPFSFFHQGGAIESYAGITNPCSEISPLTYTVIAE